MFFIIDRCDKLDKECCVTVFVNVCLLRLELKEEKKFEV